LPARLLVVVECPYDLDGSYPPDTDWAFIASAWRKKCLIARDYVASSLYRMRHPGGSGAARWMPLAKHVGWPAATLPTLRAVIHRESRGIPTATNGIHRGLLQIRQDHSPSTNLLSAPANLVIGLRMYRRSGWTPWSL